MNKRYSMLPDDNSNEFGKANSLDTRGGVFDSYGNKRRSDSGRSVRSDVSGDVITNKLSGSAPIKVSSGSAALSRELSGKTDGNESKRSEKGVKALNKKAVGMLAAVLAAGAMIWAVVFFCTHALFGELTGSHEFISYGVKEIDLSESNYGDYKALSKMSCLETVNLTGSAFDNLPELYDCKRLKSVILSDRELTAEECVEFYKNLPDAHLVCSVNIDGRVYDSGITYLKAENAGENTQRLYASLNNLEKLDMTSCDVSDDTYKLLAGALPKCAIIIRTSLCGRDYTTDSKTLELIGKLTAEDAERVRYFKNLEDLNLTKCTNPDILDDYLSAHTGIKVNRSIALLGRYFGTEDQSIDLRCGRYNLKQVTEVLEETLPKMKSVKKIDMCGCGLSDEEMEKLCDTFPKIKFVWTVKIGELSVRTDALVFSVAGKTGKGNDFNEQDYAPLFRYCRELIAIDLGNSKIADISEMSSLKKLRAVCLSNNPFSDISALSQMSELEFIEMSAGNHVKSADALRGLQNLRYVNFWSNRELTDLSPLYDHEKLEMAVFHSSVPLDERKWFKKSNPDCVVSYSINDGNPTTKKKWDDNPYRKSLRNALNNWMFVVDFNSENGEYVFDFDTDRYKYIT